MSTIYPNLPPSAPEIEESRDSYQYKRVMSIEQELYSEIKTYKSSLNRYKMIIKTIHFVMGICSIITIITAITGFIDIMSIQTHYILSLIGGTGGVIFAVISYKVEKQVEKHSEKLMLARNTTYMLKNMISAALRNGVISDIEFHHITDCIKKYYEMKKDVDVADSSKKDFEKEFERGILKGEQKAKEELKSLLVNCFKTLIIIQKDSFSV